MVMSEQQSLPLDFSIPHFPSRDLSWVANHARWILKRNRRTNSQVIHVQKLIRDLIDIYWQEEREKEKQRLETEVRARLAKHHWGKEEDEGPDLYPFALRHNRYGEFLEFVGDESELNLPGDGDLDDVEVLNEIIEWFTDNESVEGFVDAGPSEYFAALALLLAAESVYFIPSIEKVNTTKVLADMGCFIEPAMKAMKAIGYARLSEMKAKHELNLLASEEKIDVLMSEKAVLTEADVTDAYKVLTQKANTARHVKNREAKELVCARWLENREKFKSLMAAAKHYKLWLEGLKFYYELSTVSRWLMLCAKNNPIDK